MRVYIRANSDEAWTSKRLVKLINMLSKLHSGCGVLFETEEEAIEVNNVFAKGHLETHRTIMFEIISQEDINKTLDA